MQAASAQLDAAVSNIANSQTIGGIPGTVGGVRAPVYQPVTVTLSDASRNGGSGGVSATASSSSNYSRTYNPDAPIADVKGYVATPNVGVATELVNALLARTQFEASAMIVKVASDMQKAAIDILA